MLWSLNQLSSLTDMIPNAKTGENSDFNSNKFINFSYISFMDISDYYRMVYLEMIKSLLHSVNDGNDISHCVQLLSPSNTSTCWGCWTAHCAGSVGLRRKPRLTFSVNVRPWLHSDTDTWVPPSWNQRTFRV